MIVLRIFICLLAALVGLPLKGDGTVFRRRPGITCGVRGGDAHLVWNYNDTADTVGLIRWINGTEATGTSMGTYLTAPPGSFTALGNYTGEISFTSPVYTAGFKGANLTLYRLEASDAGNYTTVFQANARTVDISVLEVADPDGLGTWEICVDGTCKSISDSLTLSASSADVKVKFIKTLGCGMDIDVNPSVGDSFVLVVPAGPGATAEHPLADPATLLAAETLSIDLAFGKNGEVFYTDTIAAVSVESDVGGLAPWVIAVIVLGVLFLVVIIGVVIVVVRKKRARSTRGKETHPLQGQKNPEQTPSGNQTA